MLCFTGYEPSIVFSNVCVSCAALHGSTKCVTVQFNESIGQFSVWRDAIGNMEFGSECCVVIHPSVSHASLISHFCKLPMYESDL